MISLEQLRKELGAEFKFDADEEQVRVLDADGFDVTFIDLQSGIIEHEISVKWHDNDDARRPDAASLAQAAVDEEMRQDWESAGFVVSESGSMGDYWYKNTPDTKLPLYRVSVSKQVNDAQDATETVRWIKNADDTVWL